MHSFNFEQRQMFWNDLDHCRTFILLWSKCCRKSSNGTYICWSMVFTTIILCCNCCRYLLCYQVNLIKSNSSIVHICNLLFHSFPSPPLSIVDWFCRTYSSRQRRNRRKKVQFLNLSAQWLIVIFGKNTMKLFISFLNYYFHIFFFFVSKISLTPPYLVVIALTGLVTIYLRDTSQYWMIEHNDINCPKYWWRNLFYIQNLYPLNDMCMTWSWFLAADFQCFVLTSLLLVIYTK